MQVLRIASAPLRGNSKVFVRRRSSRPQRRLLCAGVRAGSKMSLWAVHVMYCSRATGDAQTIDVGNHGHGRSDHDRCAGAECQVEKDGCHCHVMSPASVGSTPLTMTTTAPRYL